MTLRFSKMHGLGNDFMVIDGIRQSVELTPERLKQWGNRHFGVGFDQLLLVEAPHDPHNDFRYRIFNCDGSEVEQCGNGARCFARFVYDQKLTTKRVLRVETARGVIEPELLEDGLVKVNMGVPQFAPDVIPFVAEREQLSYELALNHAETVEISVVSMGNPHAVQRVDDVEHAPVASQGALIERHDRFPQRVNAGFMQILNRRHIRLRVFERGAGETLACGTGACAAVVTGIRQGWLDTRVQVDTRGGSLIIEWNACDDAPVMMTGEAVTVFHGVLHDD